MPINVQDNIANLQSLVVINNMLIPFHWCFMAANLVSEFGGYRAYSGTLLKPGGRSWETCYLNLATTPATCIVSYLIAVFSINNWIRPNHLQLACINQPLICELQNKQMARSLYKHEEKCLLICFKIHRFVWMPATVRKDSGS